MFDYVITLRNIRTKSFEVIYSSNYLSVGSIVTWGPDEQQPDGLARWEVCVCEARNPV